MSGRRLIIILLAVMVLGMMNSPATAAVALDPERRLTPSPECDTGDHVSPQVAFNFKRKEFLVVWHNQWQSAAPVDIYGQRVSELGANLGWFPITSDPVNQGRPALAHNAVNDEYLVVWMRQVVGEIFEIWGRRLKWDGSALGTEFRIFSWANRKFYEPRVAWNSARNEYLVIWWTIDTVTSQPFDVAGCRVSAAGMVIGGGPIIITDIGQPKKPNLVYNQTLDRYMVVWERSSPVPGDDIYGCFLDSQGQKMNPPGEFPISVQSTSESLPAVATSGKNEFLVVWQHFDDSYTPGDSDIRGCLFRADGSPSTLPFDVVRTNLDEATPQVTFLGGNQKYLIAWHHSAPLTGQVNTSARLRDSLDSWPIFDVANSSTFEAGPPGLAGSSGGALIAYTKRSGTTGYNVFGRLFWPEAIFLPLILR
jgi:hypothetical protein